jgi:glyoxylase-like metal-dependent hydrolase (beta-lactamase superfamily II)
MTAIHRIEVPIPYAVKWVNCYYIEDSAPTLIDTGMNNPESFDALATGIRSSGGDISLLRRIIATHGHSDHAGLARRISDMSGAEIFVHSWDRSKLSNGVHLETRIRAFRKFLFEAGVPDSAVEHVVGSLSDMFTTLMCPVSEATMLNGGEAFEFDDFQLRVIHAPGHSPGSVCLFDEASGHLFSGDCILGEIIADPAWDMKSLVAHQASLDSIADLPVQKVLPGHGAAFSSHRRRIGRIQAHHERRSQKILSILKRSDDPKHETPFSIASELFPSMKGMDVLYCVSTVRAHLELLEARGEIECFPSGGNGH